MTDRGDSYRSVWRHMMTVPFKQDYVEAAGVRTRYVQAGRADAPAVLLIHGTSGHWEAFCSNIGPLSEHFNVFAIDLMGCGFSGKPDHPYEIANYATQVIGFMDAMAIQKASLIGVSLGSWTTARVALDHPDRVERMILISPAGLLSPEVLAAAVGVEKAIATRRDSTLDPSWEKISATLADLHYDRESVLEDIIAVRQQIYKSPDMQRAAPHTLTLFDPATAFRNALTEDQWRSIKTPTLLVANVDVEDMFLAAARRLSQILPSVQTIEIKKVAHWAQLEAPEQFNTAALAFLSPDQARARARA